jgi:hypothetical protein
MIFGEISKWAKSKGYKITRKDGCFHWHKLDETKSNGVENTLDETATAIFNNLTNNKWVEYQENYRSKIN